MKNKTTFPKRFYEIVHSLSLRERIKMLGLKLAPDSTEDRKEVRALYRELRSFVDKGSQSKIRSLLRNYGKEVHGF